MSEKSKVAAPTKVEAAKPEKANVKVKFSKSPTGLLGLGYSAGDEAKITKSQADLMVKEKFGTIL